MCWVSLSVVRDSRAALQGGSLLCSDSYFVSVHARHSQRWHGVGFGLVGGLVVKRAKKSNMSKAALTFRLCVRHKFTFTFLVFGAGSPLRFLCSVKIRPYVFYGRHKIAFIFCMNQR